MRVSVKLYASLAKYAGVTIMHEPIEVDLPSGSSLLDLYQRLNLPGSEVKTAFVNSTMQEADYTLREGDEVGIFPPVGGG